MRVPKFVLVALVVGSSLATAAPASAADHALVVTSAGDSTSPATEPPPKCKGHEEPKGKGKAKGHDNRPCTLRDAMLAANAQAGRDRIVFRIPGPGPHVIALVAPLPTVSDVEIDGTTQPGIEVDGSGGGSGPAFELLDDVVLRGLGVHGSPGVAVAVAGSRTTVEGNDITTSHTGVLLTGASPATPETDVVVSGNTITGNQTDGVTITDRSSGAVLDGNTITGNGLDGVSVSADGVTVDGNVIGTNGRFGVFLSGIPTDLVVGAAITGNTIEDNANSGIQVSGAQGSLVDGNTIEGNSRGILVTSLGGTTTSNTISGNAIRLNDTFGVNVLEQGCCQLSGTRITQNSIHDNGPPTANGRGINLNAGANDGVQPPTVLLATATPTQTTASGTVSAPAGTTVVIELFSNLACDLPPTNGGEGRTYLGSTTVTAAGPATPWVAVVDAPTGGFLAATATHEPVGNTSRFSTCVPIL